jgi:type III pantothenate kinase
VLVAIDVGNSSIHFGAFELGGGGERLAAEWRITTTPHKTADEYGIQMIEFLRLNGYSHERVRGVAICSVVPTLTPALAEAAEKYFGCRPFVIGPDTRTGLKNRYHKPEDVGTDRIVNAVAVHRRRGGPAIIVDFGTATTIDVVTRAGEYLGGAISPGVMISAEALFARAAKLQVVELRRPRSAVGRDPVTSIQSGVVLGYASLVDGMIDRIRAEIGARAHVVATGGLAALILPESKKIQEFRPYLTLEGLLMLYHDRTGRQAQSRPKPRRRS